MHAPFNLRKLRVVCVDMTQANWAADTTRRIAASVKALRGKRSAQWLADRTAELGYPISRNAISNLEAGRKHAVEVPELLVLATALGVPPVQLLFPVNLLPDGPVEVLPGHSAPAGLALRWFTGEDVESPYLPCVFDGPRAPFVTPLQLVRRYYRGCEQLAEFENELTHVEPRSAAADNITDRRIRTRMELDSTRAAMRAVGLTVEDTDR